MGIIQKATPLQVEGNPSYVSGRIVRSDAEEGWSVTARPYCPTPSDDETGFLCHSEQPTCFLAGNRVLMGDGSLLRIEDIQVGDCVMTMQGPDQVRALERPTLGMSRKVIELRGQADECLFISDEHPLWVSRRTAQGGTVESWGTYNLNHLMFEMRNSIEPRMPSMPVPLHIDLPEQLAHVSGWIHVRPIYHHMAPSTQLYNIATERGCAIFVEGFAAFSHCLGALVPQAPWHGLVEDCAAGAFLRQFSATPL